MNLDQILKDVTAHLKTCEIQSIRVDTNKKGKRESASVTVACVKPQSKADAWGCYGIMALLIILLFFAVFRVPACLWERVETETSSVSITNRCSGVSTCLSFEAQGKRVLRKE